MKNGEQPIAPTTIFDSSVNSFTETKYLGLTKREYFAGIAISTLPPPRNYVGEKETKESYFDWAYTAVKMSDALLKVLEETNEQ